jgi:hypothetical protein
MWSLLSLCGSEKNREELNVSDSMLCPSSGDWYSCVVLPQAFYLSHLGKVNLHVFTVFLNHLQQIMLNLPSVLKKNCFSITTDTAWSFIYVSNPKILPVIPNLTVFVFGMDFLVSLGFFFFPEP